MVEDATTAFKLERLNPYSSSWYDLKNANRAGTIIPPWTYFNSKNNFKHFLTKIDFKFLINFVVRSVSATLFVIWQPIKTPSLRRFDCPTKTSSMCLMSSLDRTSD